MLDSRKLKMLNDIAVIKKIVHCKAFGHKCLEVSVTDYRGIQYSILVPENTQLPKVGDVVSKDYLQQRHYQLENRIFALR